MEFGASGHAAAPTHKFDRVSRPSSVSADAEPLRNGMTATGSHEYFYSLRGAQPPGVGFFRSIGGADDNVKAFHNQDKTPAG